MAIRIIFTASEGLDLRAARPRDSSRTNDIQAFRTRQAVPRRFSGLPMAPGLQPAAASAGGANARPGSRPPPAVAGAEGQVRRGVRASDAARAGTASRAA